MTFTKYMNQTPNPKLQNNHINSEMCEIQNDGIWIFNNLDFDIFNGKSYPYSHFSTPNTHHNIWIFIPHPNSTTPIHSQIDITTIENDIQLTTH